MKKSEKTCNCIPNYDAYHQSITNELLAITHRVDSIVKNHWLTVGEDKESVFRSILRRLLPDSISVCRGFIASNAECSTQIDVLIIDQKKPKIYKEGDLVIVMPDAVVGVIEIKSSFDGQKERIKAIEKLIKIKHLCNSNNNNHLWTGIYVFDGTPRAKKSWLSALGNTFITKNHYVDCIASGTNLLLKYHNFYSGFGTIGHQIGDYNVEKIAPSAFMRILIEHINIKYFQNSLQIAQLPDRTKKTTIYIRPRNENKFRLKSESDDGI